MTTFFEHQKTSFKRSYLANLITMASADGNLDETERELIIKIGRKRGLKDWQITELLADHSSKPLFLPEAISNRMEMLFDLMQIVYADSSVTTSEVKYITNIVHELKLRSEIVDQLVVMFAQGTPSSTEWREFVQFVSDDVLQLENR
jgi:uncharacterized tellurite resistance protein B-like protein